eukprot:gene19287-19681_t
MAQQRQKIAVIGAGISGLASAYFLARRHDVVLYEAADYLGGHTNTVDVTLEDKTFAVDTGFLVFNEATYPNLIALFDELGVASHATDMSFGVSLSEGRFEWAGTNLDTVFAQRRRALSPAFLGMLRDILRFNRCAPANLDAALVQPLTLAHLVADGNYGKLAAAYLLRGQVMHERLRPVHHRFVYPVFCVRLNLARLAEAGNIWFGIDRRRLMSLRMRDYGPRDGSSLDAWMRLQLSQAGLPADGEIWLQTFPRVFGIVFNPVSFWYCHDSNGVLRAVLAEVNNTFGQTY